MSKRLTFTEYLNMVSEDTASDISKLQSDIAMLDASINQKTAPLLQQRHRLQKMLAIKQKQKESEDARNQRTQQANPQTPTQPGQQQQPPAP